MRITKQIAAGVAAKMSKPAFDAAKALHDELRKLVTEFRIANTPKEILEAFKDPKLNPYIRACNGLNIQGMGLFSEFVRYTDGPLPEASEYIKTFTLTSETEYIAFAFNRWQDAVEDAEALRKELEITLLNLKTFTRVQQDLPEAVDYLPSATTTALAIDTSKLREKLKRLSQNT